MWLTQVSSVCFKLHYNGMPGPIANRDVLSAAKRTCCFPGHGLLEEGEDEDGDGEEMAQEIEQSS